MVQLINILTLGNPEGVGVFFPKGLLGAITKPTGYNASSPGNQAYPSQLASQPANLVTTQVMRPPDQRGHSNRPPCPKSSANMRRRSQVLRSRDVHASGRTRICPSEEHHSARL